MVGSCSGTRASDPIVPYRALIREILNFLTVFAP